MKIICKQKIEKKNNTWNMNSTLLKNLWVKAENQRKNKKFQDGKNSIYTLSQTIHKDKFKMG